jgi:hypothetical protein
MRGDGEGRESFGEKEVKNERMAVPNLREVLKTQDTLANFGEDAYGWVSMMEQYL